MLTTYDSCLDGYQEKKYNHVLRIKLDFLSLELSPHSIPRK